MSQGAASQDASQGAGGVVVRYMGGDYGGGRGEYGRAGGGGSGGGRAEVTPWQCEFCHKYYGSNNSLRNHRSVYHRRQAPEGSLKVTAVVPRGGSSSLHSARPLLPPVQHSLSLPQRTPPSLPPHLSRLTPQNFGSSMVTSSGPAPVTTSVSAPHPGTPAPPT
nr:uncharacterized protein LOC123747756 isoform X1 [Procambarus clarkii]